MIRKQTNGKEREAHEEADFFLAHLAGFAVQILICPDGKPALRTGSVGLV
jgi:hypothetical protein